MESGGPFPAYPTCQAGRPDHGSNGAYPSWPAFALEALCYVDGNCSSAFRAARLGGRCRPQARIPCAQVIQRLSKYKRIFLETMMKDELELPMPHD